jgi:hypothetical protein
MKSYTERMRYKGHLLTVTVTQAILLDTHYVLHLQVAGKGTTYSVYWEGHDEELKRLVKMPAQSIIVTVEDTLKSLGEDFPLGDMVKALPGLSITELSIRV